MTRTSHSSFFKFASAIPEQRIVGKSFSWIYVATYHLVYLWVAINNYCKEELKSPPAVRKLQSYFEYLWAILVRLRAANNESTLEDFLHPIVIDKHGMPIYNPNLAIRSNPGSLVLTVKPKVKKRARIKRHFK